MHGKGLCMSTRKDLRVVESRQCTRRSNLKTKMAKCKPTSPSQNIRKIFKGGLRGCGKLHIIFSSSRLEVVEGKEVPGLGESLGGIWCGCGVFRRIVCCHHCLVYKHVCGHIDLNTLAANASKKVSKRGARSVQGPLECDSD